MKFPYHWLQPEPFPNYENHIFGTIDVRVFLQDELWVDVAGQACPLEKMDEEYLFNILQHVFQNGEYFYSVMVQWYSTAFMVVVVLEALGQDPDLIQNFKDDFQKFSEYTSAHQWLSGTPLVRKLNQLLDEKDRIKTKDN